MPSPDGQACTPLVVDDAAVFQRDDPVSQLENTVVVGHHHGCRASDPPELFQHLHHNRACIFVERRCWLVGENDIRIAHQRPRNRHALLLTARQLIRQILQAICKAERAQ